MPVKDLKVLDGDALKQLNLDLGDVLDQLLKSVETTTLQSLPFLEIESFVPKTEEKEDTITNFLKRAYEKISEKGLFLYPLIGI